MSATWFLFDLGNTLIKLDYERVLENICRNATIKRDALVQLLENAGGYRDMERGAVTFADFYHFVCDNAGFRGSMTEFRKIWSDFFDGTVPGMEDLLMRVRKKHRIAFLSNSNEVHAVLIPRLFSSLFEKTDRVILSHRLRVAKPDADIFRRSLEILGALPHQVVFIDDMLENVLAARTLGIHAFQFVNADQLAMELESEGLL